MKRLLFILLLPLNMLAQDTIQIPQSELEKFFLALDTLREQDSIKTQLISDLNVQILNYKSLSYQDSTLLIYKDQEVNLLKSQINLHIDRIKYVDKWYKKPWVGIAAGVVGTLITIHVLDYTLPQ